MQYILLLRINSLSQLFNNNLIIKKCLSKSLKSAFIKTLPEAIFTRLTVSYFVL